MKVKSVRSAAEVEALVRDHQGSIRGYLVFLGCRSDRVDDLVQDTFLSVLSSSFEHRSAASTSAYLRKVARHLHLKSREREQRQLTLAEWGGVELAWIEFEADDGGQGYLNALRECLRSVRGRPHEVLQMRYAQSLQLAVIATRLELTESGIKSILVRTRRKLRDCIERRQAS